jgi:hypothetical protein
MSGAVGQAPTPSDPRIKQVLLRPYVVPQNTDMAVLLVYYNPASSVRIFQNLLTVKQKFETAQIPYYIAELAYEDQPFAFPPSDIIFQYRSTSFLFYKENLINLAEKRIPSHFTKICTLDADIVFAKPDWYDRISSALNDHDICQCFEQGYLLDFTFSNIIETKTPAKRGGHSGFGWAVRRDFFTEKGFPEKAVVGSGDYVFAIKAPYVYHEYYDDLKKYYAEKIGPLRMTYASGVDVFHLFHGPSERRQYVSRHVLVMRYLKSVNKRTITDILDKRADGLLIIKPEYLDGFNAVMRTYFMNRSDDGI